MRLVPIRDLDDPRVAPYRDVRDADLRRESGLFMAEGRGAVRRLVGDSLYRPHSVLLTPTALSAMEPSLEPLPDEVPVYLAEQPLLDRVVGYPMHRGCLAAGERREALPPEAVLAPSGAPSTLLALEQITNPDNMGGIFRNALAFGVDGVWLCPRCVDPLYRKSIRVSMGASLRVPFAREGTWPGGLDALRAAGYRTVALETSPEAIGLDELCKRELAGDRIAILVGTEGGGLSPAVLRRVDWRARIAMAPGVDSLNAATATGIALHRLCGRGLS